MRFVVWFLLLFVGAVICATIFGSNDGLVSFFWKSYRLDLSINLFLLLLIEVCFILVLVMQGLRALMGLPRRAKEWRALRKERSAQSAFRESLALYFGGRYGRAEKFAQRALQIQSDSDISFQDHGLIALLHLLKAACAHRLQHHAHRDSQLALAYDVAQRHHQEAIEEGGRLLAAEWALDDRDAPRALSLLEALPPRVARRTQALQLKLQAARLGMRPQEALKTARLLAKHQAISAEAAASLIRSLAFESIDMARDTDQIQRIWLEFDISDQRDPFVAARAALRIANLGGAEHGRVWLRPFWDNLAPLTSEERQMICKALVACLQGISMDWLPCLEASAQDFPRESAVLHAVGTALAHWRLWGKAHTLLMQAAQDLSFNEHARRQAWLSLAQMAEHEGDKTRMLECYREAASLGT